jgi:hypothetical protein
MAREALRKWVAIACLLTGVAALSARKEATGASELTFPNIHKEDTEPARERPILGGHLHSSEEGDDCYFSSNGKAFVLRRWRPLLLPSSPPAVEYPKEIVGFRKVWPEVCEPR